MIEKHATIHNLDLHSTWLENGLFKYRTLLLFCCALLTVVLGWKALDLKPDTQLEKVIPLNHNYIKNALELDDSDKGRSLLRIAVSVPDGDIFNAQYLDTLRQVSDEVSLLPGVDTGALLSLWSPGLKWYAVSEEGFVGGSIISPSEYDGSRSSIEVIRNNLQIAGMNGSYVANDFKASMIDVPVLTINPVSGEALDFSVFSSALESIREKYEAQGVRLHIIGDVKKYADLVDGFSSISFFFTIAIVMTTLLLFWYSRCIRATLAPIVCSLVAVTWQLGILSLLGYGVGVFSVLVPFLVFAIGISHGVQIINAVAHEAGKGHDSLNAARITFRHLVKPGGLALISDGIGFITLLVIAIGAIRDLALAASIGVLIMIVTNLLLLPIILSLIGVSKRCVTHAQTSRLKPSPGWERLARLTRKKEATVICLVAAGIAVAGFFVARDARIGDLNKGAPELRVDSRYNQDNQYITGHFSISTDLMTLFVTTPEQQCESYKTIDLIDRLEWTLMNTPGVQSVSSSASAARLSRYINNEGNLKFMSLARDERVLSRAVSNGTDFDPICNLSKVRIDLADHQQDTLNRVIAVIENFSNQYSDPEIKFLLGSGNASFEAATNQVIESAQYEMLVYVYGIVSLMCLLMFRSWRAVICIILPLAVTSILCQALMAVLGIGIKVGTLPVIALGVGIGVDYGIYIFSRLKSCLTLGHSLERAYQETLKTTGKAVLFTAVTLAIGVGSWVFSPIKFQADMGLLLTFMFIWNMLGALCFLPALAYFLLGEKTAEAAPCELPVSERS